MIRTFVIQKVFLLVFTIFIFMQNKGQNETQVKLIIITYLNKIVVSYTSIMIMVYINVLQFDVCSYLYVLVYWLHAYLLRDLWDAIIMIGYLSVHRYNSVNFASTAYPVVFQCLCVCHMACVEFTLVALLCSHCTFLLSAGVGRADWNEDGYHRELQLWNAVSSSLSATQRGFCIVTCSCSLGPVTIGV